MVVNFTPITNGADADADTFNAPLLELDGAIEDIKDGTVTLPAPEITSFANAQHDHENAAGGGQIDGDAFSAPVGVAKGGTGSDLSATGPGVLRQGSVGAAVGVRLDNYAASVSPTVDDDSGDGYEVGSLWYDTTADIAWVCLDTSVGAAVWKPIVGSQVPLMEGTLSSSPASVAITGWAGSGYTKLIVEWLKIRTDRAGVFDPILMRFNGDSTVGNYFSQFLRGYANTTVDAAQIIGTLGGVRIGFVGGANADANFWSYLTVEIALPEDVAYNRVARGESVAPSGTTNELAVAIAGGAWTGVAAISTITFLSENGANILSGSRWKLYGVR